MGLLLRLNEASFVSRPPRPTFVACSMKSRVSASDESWAWRPENEATMGSVWYGCNTHVCVVAYEV